MNLTVYIGPYLVVPKTEAINVYDWEHLVYSGRGEMGANESGVVLLPNCKIDGLDREMDFDRFSSDNEPIQNIGPTDVTKEKAALTRFASEFINHCRDAGVVVKECWGVVPGYF